MEQNELIKKISYKLGDPINKHPEYLFNCCNPNCDSHKKNDFVKRKKLSLNIEKGCWKCWICESKGSNINSLLRNIGINESYKKQKEQVEADQLKEKIKNIDVPTDEFEKYIVKIPDEFKVIVSNQDINSDYFKQAIIYLRKRGISYFDIIKYRIHYNTKDYQVLIPSYDDSGDINTYFIRNIFTSWKETSDVPKTKIVFNELFIDWQSPIILVEGIFDAFTAKNNAIPIMGSSLRSNHKLFTLIEKYSPKVYLSLDQDAEKKMFKIAKSLFYHGIDVNIVKLPADKDINDIGNKEFEKCLNESEVYNDMTSIKEQLFSLK